jgi:hypothetical protein
MSAIIRSIINQAYQLSGIIAMDEVSDGTQTNIALIKLNDILAQLNKDQLFPYSKVIAQYTPSESKHKYTIGMYNNPTADIQYDRPSFINRLVYASSDGAMFLDVQQLDVADLSVRRVPSQSMPRFFSYNLTYPYAEIHFDCALIAGSKIEIVYNKEIEVVDINSVLQVPPEYNSVLVTSLARHLSVLNQMPDDVVTRMDILYKDAIGVIKAANIRSQIPILDDILGTSSPLGRNIYNYG